MSFIKKQFVIPLGIVGTSIKDVTENKQCAYCIDDFDTKLYDVKTGETTVQKWVCNDCKTMLEVNGFKLTLVS